MRSSRPTPPPRTGRRLPRRGWLVLLLILAVCGPPAVAAASDAGNCLLCHRNRGLSRLDEDGNLRLFFVNEETYQNSVHSKIECEGCHADIDKVPHGGAEPVDCLRTCHLVEPTTEVRFSHQDAAESLSISVHGTADEDGVAKDHADDYPDCKDCHENPMYRPLSFFKTVEPGISEEAVGRCRVCHKDDAFIFGYYNHVTTRLHRSRSPKNIADVCARCHDDPGFGQRHDLVAQAVVSYEATFHGKAASYLDESVPDCLDCHVSKGESVHQMRTSGDPLSSTHPDNKASVCSQRVCHPNAPDIAAKYDVHAEFRPEGNPPLFWFTMFFYTIAGGTLLPLFSLILLDLLRRLFPGVVIRGRRR